MKLLCQLRGHRLQTSVHWSGTKTLWCARCRRVQWYVHPSGYIVRSGATNQELGELGIPVKPEPGDV